MVHQMAQEGSHWPSGVIRLGPHLRSSKMKWANIVHAMLDVGTYKYNKVIIVNIVGAVKNAVAQP